MVLAATVTIPIAAVANTLSLADYNGPNDQITCTPSCEGFIGGNPGIISLSLTNADDYDQAGDPAAELALLNVLLGQFNPARPAVSFVNKTDVGTSSYATSRQYFSIKQATNLWYFRRIPPAERSSIQALGNNWSHTTEYRSVNSGPSSSSLLIIFGLYSIDFEEGDERVALSTAIKIHEESVLLGARSLRRSAGLKSIVDLDALQPLRTRATTPMSKSGASSSVPASRGSRTGARGCSNSEFLIGCVSRQESIRNPVIARLAARRVHARTTSSNANRRRLGSRGRLSRVRPILVQFVARWHGAARSCG